MKYAFKPLIATLLLACLPAALLAQETRASSFPRNEAVRRETNLNRDWKFVLGDPADAQAPHYDDSSWAAVGLPHSFSIPYFLSPDFYVGYGWYRRHVNVPESSMGKRFFLEFQGVFQEAEVFVNGRAVGRHRGGYTGFSLDITDALKRGDNLIAVRVNNLWNPQLAPRAGEHVFSGGIYRDVHLVVTDPLHVTWYGTFVTTPSVSRQAAIVNVKTEVRNDANAAAAAVVESTVVDARGKAVAQVRSDLRVPPHQQVSADQTTRSIADPDLWSPEHPAMYHLHTAIYKNGRLVDTFDTPFGIRSIKFTADQGFFLNGVHCYLRGANVHQDHAGWGDAVTDGAIHRDVAMVKEAGFNFIRGSHYPHAPAFADACDQQGVMLWSENPFWGTGGFKPDGYWNSSAYPPLQADQAPFEASTKQELAEMIRIFRNHPSIIAWSMSNEPFFSTPAVMPRVRQLLKELVALSHELDPTRPAGIGGCQRGEIDKLGDVAGYNGDGARLFINPGVPSVVTEYGSVSSERPGPYDPHWGDLPKGPHSDSKPYFWHYSWRSGEAIWCMFDHGSIAGPGLGRMGIVDYFRIPKRAWYWYRSEYAHVPAPAWPEKGVPAALQLSADKSTIIGTDATDDVHLVITVLNAAGTPISNSPPVHLQIVSGPGEFPTGPSIDFDPKSDIPIRDGVAAIEFRSYFGGQSVIRATSPGLKSAKITIQTLGTPRFVAGVTPPATPRPYVRFVKNAIASAVLTLGRDNPTLASSEAAGHSAPYANDGDPATNWQSADSDASPWWQVDLERVCNLSAVKCTLAAHSEPDFSIELSEDGRTWRSALDVSPMKKRPADKWIRVSNGQHVRFVRIKFAGIAPGGHVEVNEFLARGRIAGR